METAVMDNAVEQGVIVGDFVLYTHSSGALVEDARIVDIEQVSDTEIDIIVASDHDVNNSGGRDYFNDYASYVRHYFSSDQWAQHITLSAGQFKGHAAAIAEEMNDEYHNDYFSGSAFAMKGRLTQELSKFAERHPDADGTFDAHDVYFGIKVNRIEYFPESYIISKYEEDVKNKYNKTSGNYLADFAATLRGKDTQPWIIKEAQADSSSIDVKVALHHAAIQREFQNVYETFFDRSEWVRFVTTPLWGNPHKLADKWNPLFYDAVLGSDYYQEIKSRVKSDLQEFSWKLRQDNKITEEQYSEMFHAPLSFDLIESSYFTAEKLSFRADQEKKETASRRRR